MNGTQHIVAKFVICCESKIGSVKYDGGNKLKRLQMNAARSKDRVARNTANVMQRKVAKDSQAKCLCKKWQLWFH